MSLPATEPLMPPPREPGERHELRITDVAFGGEGVGRVEDFVVFVPFVMSGERVEVELTDVRKHFARARLIRVIEPSPDRVEPGCRYFGECGGCQYQHVGYAEQLRLKQKQVADLVQRLGGFPPTVVQPVVPCPQPYGYRNRLMIRSQWNKPAQKLDLGFIRHDNRLVVDLEECAIAEPMLNEQIRGVRAKPPPKGGIKIVLRVQPVDWDVPPDSFFQNNFFLLPGLVETVRDRLRASGVRRLVDVYCGVGFFGIEMASVVEAFVGVECDRQAIRAARRNADRRGVTNGEFVEGDATECLPGLLTRFDPRETAVLLDPPRAGCRPEAIDQLRTVGPGQILYVSCHPATLARDLKALCADGAYRLERVTPLDMFPQTQHVECVADLRREPAADGSSPDLTLPTSPAFG
ncbi:MAG: class I SAM-dependent RNA methyltransferase [Limisphaerales bacterium]